MNMLDSKIKMAEAISILENTARTYASALEKPLEEITLADYIRDLSALRAIFYYLVNNTNNDL